MLHQSYKHIKMLLKNYKHLKMQQQRYKSVKMQHQKYKHIKMQHQSYKHIKMQQQDINTLRYSTKAINSSKCSTMLALFAFNNQQSHIIKVSIQINLIPQQCLLLILMLKYCPMIKQPRYNYWLTIDKIYNNLQKWWVGSLAVQAIEGLSCGCPRHKRE